MHGRTFKAIRKFPVIVTVWDDGHPFYGKACEMFGRDGTQCQVEYEGNLKLAHYRKVALGDNSYALEDQ